MAIQSCQLARMIQLSSALPYHVASSKLYFVPAHHIGEVGGQPSDGRMVVLSCVGESRLRNDLYCVEWDAKLYYTIPYHTVGESTGLIRVHTIHGLLLQLCQISLCVDALQ